MKYFHCDCPEPYHFIGVDTFDNIYIFISSETKSEGGFFDRLKTALRIIFNKSYVGGEVVLTHEIAREFANEVLALVNKGEQ